MAKVKWSNQAIDDLNEVGNYIEKVSLQYAQEQVKRLYKKGEQLQEHPHLGRPVPELNDKTVRQILCYSYRIIYEIHSEDELTILTVHHQSRLLENNPVFKEE